MQSFLMLCLLIQEGALVSLYDALLPLLRMLSPLLWYLVSKAVQWSPSGWGSVICMLSDRDRDPEPVVGKPVAGVAVQISFAYPYAYLI